MVTRKYATWSSRTCMPVAAVAMLAPWWVFIGVFCLNVGIIIGLAYGEPKPTVPEARARSW